jgi:hypothetical protein
VSDQADIAIPIEQKIEGSSEPLEYKEEAKESFEENNEGPSNIIEKELD